jgi:hypothetical protein
MARPLIQSSIGELLQTEIAAKAIQNAVRNKKAINKKQKQANKKMAKDIIDENIENAIIEEETSPNPTILSIASTTFGKVRKSRSDKGGKRDTPFTKKNRVNREMQQLMSEYTPERRQRIIEEHLQADKRAKTREQMR